MAARRSRMSGDFKLRRTLRTLHQTMDNELAPVMRDSAERILSTMKDLIPKGTGAAAAALTVFVSKSGLDAQIGIRGKKNKQRFFYLRFVEYGPRATPATSAPAVEPAGRRTRPTAPTFLVSTRTFQHGLRTPGFALRKT